MLKYYFKWLIVALVCSCLGRTNAQNLVPNGDFEQYSSCPTWGGQLGLAIPWFNPSNIGTPDYFNVCADSNSGAGIPYNSYSYGYQHPQNGNAYSGIYLWRNISGSNVREYIEVPLSIYLTAGKYYHFNMFVNLMNPCAYTTSNIGVLFSDSILIGINSAFITSIPQIENTTTIFFDTLNWTSVSGDYLAHGGEKYLTIGNFNTDSLTDTLFLQTASPSYQFIYCYIDDVSLTEVTGIEENEEINFELFPNPANQNLQVNSSKPISRIVIYNIAGELVLDFNQLTGLNKLVVDVSTLTAGPYNCLVYDDKTEFSMKKFSVIK